MKFKEAIDFSSSRKAALPVEFYGDAQQRAYDRSFTVSGAASIGQVEAVLDSLNSALRSGKTFDQWKAGAAAQSLDLGDGRLSTIYRNHMQTAFNHGHWVQQQRNSDTRPYLMYDAINDSRTRPTHAAMDGAIRSIDDPFWETHYPPNGHNCRCSTVSLTEKQALARGGETREPKGGWPEPDEGWPGNPAKSYEAEPQAPESKYVKTQISALKKRAGLEQQSRDIDAFFNEAYGRGKTLALLELAKEKQAGLAAIRKGKAPSSLTDSAGAMSGLTSQQQAVLRALSDMHDTGLGVPRSLNLNGAAGRAASALAGQIEAANAMVDAPALYAKLTARFKGMKVGQTVNVDGFLLATEKAPAGPSVVIEAGAGGLPIDLLNPTQGKREWVLGLSQKFKVVSISDSIVTLREVR